MQALQPHDAIVCPLEVDSYYGIQWKSTPAATTVVEDCGDEYTGLYNILHCSYTYQLTLDSVCIHSQIK